MNFKKRSAKKVRWKFDETLNSRRAFKFDYWMGSSWFYGYSHLRVVWQQCFEDFCSTRESAIRVRESRPNIRVSINSRWTHRARRYINGNMNRYTSTYVACCILLLVIVHRSLRDSNSRRTSGHRIDRDSAQCWVWRMDQNQLHSFSRRNCSIPSQIQSLMTTRLHGKDRFMKPWINKPHETWNH